jgi:hypothetical protein
VKKISILIFLLLISGCATLPATVKIDPDEIRDVVKSFKAMISERHQCGSCIDAAARVEFKSLFQNGVVNGYLQAMSPSFLKFVGINPFGQPLVVLVTDGNLFHYLVVPEAKGYQGNIRGETFRRYAPDGFQPGFAFYWLTGRLAPGVFKIMAVSRDKEGQGYWLKLCADGNNSKSMILFDAQAGVIRRHLIIDDQDEIIMNIFYDEYTKVPCPLPGKITVKSLIHNSSMQIKLTDWLQDIDLDSENFSCRLPGGFERVIVP